MVNTDDFIKRIEIILDYYSITASAFADALGIQRSGLSHLLSGRNKPSLDFVMKIVENYPEVDLYWLLNGDGSFPKKNGTTEPAIPPLPLPAISKPDAMPDLFSTSEGHEKSKDDESRKVSESILFSDKSIERIVVFYKNGTFTSYTPEK